MCAIHMCYSSSCTASTHIRLIKSIFQMAGMNAAKGQLRIMCVNDFVRCSSTQSVDVETGAVLEALYASTHGVQCITKLCQSCYYQLRQIRTVRYSLTPSAIQTLVHAFICTRVDFSNSLLYGTSACLLDRLQSVLN